MADFVLYNKATGKCMRKKDDVHNYTWDAFNVVDCNIWDDNQKTNIEYNSDNTVNFKYGKDTLDITRENDTDAAWSKGLDVRAREDDLSINGRSPNFLLKGIYTNNKTNSRDVTEYGPFYINNTYYNGRHLDVDGGVVKNIEIDTNKDSQKWINYNLFSKCKDIGISFEQCNKDVFNDCSVPGNKNIFNTCPLQYCQNPDNVNNQECKNYCSANPGQCDSSMTTFCLRSENKDKPECGCINLPDKYKDISQIMYNNGLTFKIGCNVQQCVSNPLAYKPINLDKNCPNQVVCLQGIDTGNVGSNIELSNITFKCDINKSDSTKNLVNNYSSDYSTKNSINNSDYSTKNSINDYGLNKLQNNQYLYIGGILFFVIIVLILLIF